MGMWVCFLVGLLMIGSDCKTTELVGRWATDAAQLLALVTAVEVVVIVLIMLMVFLLLQILSKD